MDHKNNPNLFCSQAAANGANKDMHVLQCHGDADPLVPFTFGTQTAEKLKTLINPSNISFKSYRGLPHSACPEVSVQTHTSPCSSPFLSIGSLILRYFVHFQEMIDIKRFLERQLPAVSD